MNQPRSQVHNSLYVLWIDIGYRHSLRAVTQAEGIGESGAAVGIDGRAGPCSADCDIDGRRIDAVGAKALQMGQDPIARRALGGVDGPHPFQSDVAVGEVGKVEHVAPPILAL